MAELTINWMDFFITSIDAIHERFAVVLDASGCREGWLQAELFYAGRKHDLRVNHFDLGSHKKADLSCGDPPTMLAEIKVVGVWDSPKMRYLIEEDVRRMREASADADRFMILIIRESEKQTALGTFLNDCAFSDNCKERKWAEFRVRIWRV